MLIGAFLVAFIATATLVPLVGMAARALGLFAKPTEDRWHAMPVPHFGGVAMMVALLAVLQVGGLIPALWPLVMTTVLMSAIGLVDDLRPMRPATKLVLQLAASALLIYFVPPVRITGQPVVDLLLAFLWMVGITNAFNLLDNIDGLAGGVAAIVGGSFLALLRLHGGDALTPLAIATSAFVGTTLGFLIYNFKPASIFMGDSGSHAIGAFIAGATLLAAPSLKTGVMPVGLVPVVLLLIPIFDTAFVTLTRRLAGRSAFRGGRDHTSHRLVALGLGERPAVITLYALTMAGGAVAIGIERLQPGVSWGFVGMYVAGLAVVGVYLGHIPSATDGQSLEAPPLPSELTNRYRIYEVLLDIVLVTSAYYLAFLIRFREPEFSYFLPFFTGSLPIVVVTQIVTLWLSGKYRQVWRTLGPSEMLGLIRGSLAGVGASVIAVVYINRFEGYSRSVFAFDAMLAAMFLIVARVGLGALDESLRRRRASRGMALIYGAGRGGALTMRELLQNGDIGLMPVGFLDDDPSKRRLRIEGFPVLGSLEDLPAILARPASRISVVIVSVLGLPRDKSDRVCAICAERGVEVRRFRFALESVDATTPAAGVVRFKRP